MTYLAQFDPECMVDPDDCETCELCGSLIWPTEDIAEMYDPTSSESGKSVTCHYVCGQTRGYEIA